MKESTKRSTRSLASHHHRRSQSSVTSIGPFDLVHYYAPIRTRYVFDANSRHLRPLDVEGPRRPSLGFTQTRSPVIRARFLAQRRQNRRAREPDVAPSQRSRK